MKTNSLKRSVLAVAVSLGTLAAGQAWAAEQFIPIPSYRVGPCAGGRYHRACPTAQKNVR